LISEILNYMPIELCLLAIALVVLLMDMWGYPVKRNLGYFAALGLLSTMLFSAPRLWGIKHTLFGGMWILDPLALFFKELFLLLTFMVILISIDYVERKISNPGEYYAILLMVCMGTCMLVSSGELLTLFISLELVSIPLYILAGFRKDNLRSNEAGIKYFLLGAFASAIILFGISLIYGLTGTTSLEKIMHYIIAMGKSAPAEIIAAPGLAAPALIAGMLFLLVGFAFKIAAAPFHMWAPDVYQGSPTPVTAMISVAPKCAGIAIIVRVFLGTFYEQGLGTGFNLDWKIVLAILAMLSMTIGNLAALPQTNIKRLLAYSGIAQIGYLLVGLTAASPAGLTAVIFYVAIYALTNLGAFAVVILYARYSGSEEIDDYAGLARRSPPMAFIMLLALLSMAGIPPLAGFVGKFFLFAAAYQAGLWWLVIIAIINSVISLFYYLKVLRVCYFEEPRQDAPMPIPAPFRLSLGISLAAIAVLGLLPPYYSLVDRVSKTFFGL